MKESIANLDELIDSLNEEQKQVVYSTSRRLVCLAGAGTGKTHTLISKIIYSTEILKANPESILCLTFTNAAGQELKSRFTKYSQSDKAPFFGTFHSFCYYLVLNNSDICKKLGYNQIPELIDEYEENNFYTEAKLLSSTKLSKNKLKITYNPSMKEKFEFQVFQKTLDKLLRNKNKITFDRLCYRVCDLFKKKDETIHKYLDNFKYIYIDEFQDTDQGQWEFVKSFIPNSSVIIIGDARQSLYKFRGADSSIIKSIAQDESWQVIKLVTNYRSTKQICDYVNRFTDNFQDKDITIKLVSSKLGQNIRHTTTTKFLANLQTCIDHSYFTSAILCRTNKEVSYLIDKLDSAGIQYTTKCDSSFNKIIECALDSYPLNDLLLSLLTEQERSKLLVEMYKNPKYDLTGYLTKRLDDVVAKVYDIQNCDDFCQIKLLYDTGELSLKDISENSINHSPELYVGTIHSVKGLEFDSVYVYGVNSKAFKILDSEESMNLYYVACTRAKKLLTIITER